VVARNNGGSQIGCVGARHLQPHRLAPLNVKAQADLRWAAQAGQPSPSGDMKVLGCGLAISSGFFSPGLLRLASGALMRNARQFFNLRLEAYTCNLTQICQQLWQH
jgi:hypothetical protein